MSEKEAAALRLVYQEWPVQRLVRAATQEKGDYQPEAVGLMLDELKRRGVEESQFAGLVNSPPVVAGPVAWERDTLLLPARLNRKQYAVRWLLWLVIFVMGGVALEFLPVLNSEGLLGWIALALLYRIIGLDIPRMKNAGIPVWLLLMFVVPIANLVLIIALFAAPPKQIEASSKVVQT